MVFGLPVAGQVASWVDYANRVPPLDYPAGRHRAIADLNLSDSTGVIDLRQKDELTIDNGEVAVSAAQDIDNASNGLPDWWERLHGLDLFAANGALDPENDGVPNLLEYAFGGNPKVADARERGVQSAWSEVSGSLFMRLGFFRRMGDAGLLVKVQESADLVNWADLPLPQQILGAPQNMGDGTEYVEVLGTRPVTGPAAEPKGFMRVKVQKAD